MVRLCPGHVARTLDRCPAGLALQHCSIVPGWSAYIERHDDRDTWQEYEMKTMRDQNNVIPIHQGEIIR